MKKVLLTMLVLGYVHLNTYAANLKVHIINSDLGYGGRRFSEVQNRWIKRQNPQYFVFPDYKGDGGTDKRFSMRIAVQVNISLNGKFMTQRTFLPEIGKITSLAFPYEEPNSFNDRINFIIEGEGYLECRFDEAGNLASSSDVKCEALEAGWLPLWSSYVDKIDDTYNVYIYVKYPTHDKSGNHLHTFFGISPEME